MTSIGLEIRKVTIIYITTKNKPDAIILFEKECNYFIHFYTKVYRNAYKVNICKLNKQICLP